MATRCPGCMKMKTQSPICEHCGYNENIPNFPHQLPIGTVLREQYVVGKVLGQGGFGITYMGWDQNLDVPIAIKEYFPNGYVNRECTRSLSVTCGEDNWELFRHNRERFIREAKALAKLRDIPGIVRIHNFFQEHDTAYIIMEYVEGIDLKRFIRMQGRTMTPAEIFTVLRPVMEAMSKVHEAGLVHRDISPDNIMIQHNGQAKLLDFGAVREVLDADADKQLSQATEAILKQGFAPMEQYQNRGSLGPWTDVYALCATMYYCMTGKVPPDAPARLLENKSMEWNTIPGLSQSQIDALERGMALLPKQRTASTQILLTELYGEARPQNTFQTGPQTGCQSTPRSGFQTTPQSARQNSPVLENDFRNAYGTAAPQPTPPVEKIEEYPSCTLPLDTEPAGFVPPAEPERPIPQPIAVPVQEPAVEAIPATMPVQRESVPAQPVIIPPAKPVVTPPAELKPAPAAPKKKKTGLVAAIGVALAAVIGIVAFIATEDSRAYAKAEDYLEAGDYDAALEIFQALSAEDYEDSANRVLQTRYNQAEALLDEERFQKALDAFEDLAGDGYSPAFTMIDETQYRWAKELITQEDYLTALAKFRSIPTYSDADYQEEALTTIIYAKGQQAYRDEMYDRAKEYFNAIPGYQKTDSYQRLLYLRGIGENQLIMTPFLEKYFEQCREEFSFEDTAEVLVLHTFSACEYLLGKWHTSNYSHYLTFTEGEDGGYSTNYNVPWLNIESEYFIIENGEYLLVNGDTETLQYRMTLTGPDTMEVYAAKDGKTYTLIRDGK